MKLTELQEHVIAYYLLKGALDLNMDPRWWPPIELFSIICDKVRFAVSRFDLANCAAIDDASREWLDFLIARGAFLKADSEYGPMYQYQRAAYQGCVAEARAANAVVARAEAAPTAASALEFWQDAFARLGGAS
ncbi:MAG TPA: hypothetical protein VHZ99_03230 [Steroidobacteraceae bacterium]|jgi:hypothetical protein|nr:hypothetical protein [Steroidobacteraceae bacterium]